MKKYILPFLFLIIAIPVAVNAQQKTLVGDDVTLSGAGGPVVKLTYLNNTFGVLMGGYGGGLIDNTFLLGAGGYGLINDIFVSGEKLTFGYWGLVAEYIGFSDELIHFKTGALIGMGGAHLGPSDGDDLCGLELPVRYRCRRDFRSKRCFVKRISRRNRVQIRMVLAQQSYLKEKHSESRIIITLTGYMQKNKALIMKILVIGSEWNYKLNIT
jgi:hypothetical protein